MYAKSNFKKELWSTIFTSEPSKSQYKQNGSKYVITLCQSVFLGFNNYWVKLHKINFHWRILMSVNIFSLEVFDFGVSRYSIVRIDYSSYYFKLFMNLNPICVLKVSYPSWNKIFCVSNTNVRYFLKLIWFII